ncbi:MAG: (2Fe-2S)-binding protein [Rhodospirillales bacterium]|nr:(2Fe-2S)-binding protein [Rhodospirillales bacterium]
MTAVTLTVNGERRALDIEPRRLLVDVLRWEFGCFSVRFGCSHGACGCCTVHVNGAARLACLTFAVQCDGAEIATIEGAGDKGALHALQLAFMAEHALQCGYCTPGYLMALLPFVERAADPTDAEIREAMSGNICRCTGYQPIAAAVRRAIRERRARDTGHGRA